MLSKTDSNEFVNIDRVDLSPPMKAVVAEIPDFVIDTMPQDSFVIHQQVGMHEPRNADLDVFGEEEFEDAPIVVQEQSMDESFESRETF